MDEIKLADDQQLKLRLEIAEQEHALYLNAFRQQQATNLIMVDALQRARTAIRTAIYSEDGLDGGEGELVLEYIRQVLLVSGITTDELEPTNE